MECKKTYGMNSIKFTDAQQAKAIYNFKNKKKTLCRTKGAIWYTSAGNTCWIPC
jgi:hypothetical protein